VGPDGVAEAYQLLRRETVLKHEYGRSWLSGASFRKAREMAAEPCLPITQCHCHWLAARRRVDASSQAQLDAARGAIGLVASAIVRTIRIAVPGVDGRRPLKVQPSNDRFSEGSKLKRVLRNIAQV
jgi:hypothetical protein